MGKVKIIVISIICMGLSLLCQPDKVEAKDLYLSIGTGGTGGTFFPTGGAVADLIGREIPEIKGASAEVTGASVENARLVNDGKTDLGMMSWIAVYGAGLADKLPNVRTLWWIHGSPRQWIVPVESPVLKPIQLKGKRVVVGSPGSATEVVSKLEFDYYGLDYKKDITPAFLSFREGVEALKDGRVDAALVQAGVPASAVMDIVSVRKVRLLSYDKDTIDGIHKKYPFLPETVIKANTYATQKEDIHTLNTPGPMVINKNIPDDIAYKIVKVVHENQQKLANSVHRAFSLWRFDPSVSDCLPLHPGAERYYREIGLLK